MLTLQSGGPKSGPRKARTTMPKSNANSNPKSPVSTSQHLANIANALLSTGPRTEAGKAKAAMNARRHGLTGQFYVMNEADRLAYDTCEKDILQALAPVGAYETQYAISIAQDHWRLNRSRAIEYNTYGLGHHEHLGEMNADTAETEAAITQAQTWRDENRGFTNVALYEIRIRRLITLNEKRLHELQLERKAAESKAREEAELLLCQSVMNGEEISDARPIHTSGFVFAPTKLIAAMNRRASLESARYYKSCNWDNSEPWRGAFHFPVRTATPMPKAA